MQEVEQDLFALLKNDHAAGYRVVARSDGVCDADARELAVWGPSHDSMLDSGHKAESINFHPLPSGAYCISQTLTIDCNGNDGGRSISTQCLIVPPEVLARFGNNPFALVRTASAAGVWRAYAMRSSRLESCTLPGGATAVDQSLLGQ